MRPEKFSDFGRHCARRVYFLNLLPPSGPSITVTERLVALKTAALAAQKHDVVQGHGVAALLYRSPRNNRRLIYSCE